MHDVVKAGKVRYIGASSMHAWQFSKALYLADLNGWTRFAAMQNHYNLIYREEEREMLPLCADQGVGVIKPSHLSDAIAAVDVALDAGEVDYLEEPYVPHAVAASSNTTHGTWQNLLADHGDHC